MTDINNEEMALANPAEQRKPTKKDLRAQIFKTREVRSKRIQFFGVEIELRQPKLKDIINAREAEDKQAAVIETLVKYAFVPGTDEHLFDEEDADQFAELPFGADFLHITQALEELTDVNFLGQSVS